MNSAAELAAIERDVHKMRAGVLYLFSKLEAKDRYLADLVDAVWSGASTFVPGSRIIHGALTAAHVNASLANMVEEYAVGAVRGGAAFIENAAHEMKFRTAVRRGLAAIWAEFRRLLNKAYASIKGLGTALLAKARHLLDSPPWDLIEAIGETIIRFAWPAVYKPAATIEKIIDGVANFFLRGIELMRNQFAIGMSAFQEGYQRNVVRGIAFGSALLRLYEALTVGRNAGLLVKLHCPFVLIRNVLRIFMRFFEAHVLRELSVEARERFGWGGYETGGKFSFANETAGSLAKRGREFDEWFGPYALVPSVASLTMSCQVFGNEMYYLNLLDGEGERGISQSYQGGAYSRYDIKRNRAMNYAAGFVKEDANRYLKQCGIDFLHPDIKIEQRDVLAKHGEFHIRKVARSLAATFEGVIDFAQHIPTAAMPHLGI
jgi:hypothetical protein